MIDDIFLQTNEVSVEQKGVRLAAVDPNEADRNMSEDKKKRTSHNGSSDDQKGDGIFLLGWVLFLLL